MSLSPGDGVSFLGWCQARAGDMLLLKPKGVDEGKNECNHHAGK
jgi:hypothetical protein